MAFQIISVMEKQGEYKDKPYHNFLVYCVEPDTTNPQVKCGSEVERDPNKFCVKLNKALPIRQDSKQGKI